MIANELKLLNILRNIPVAFSVITLEVYPKVILINDHFVRTFGYTLEEIPTVGAWFARAYPEEFSRAEALTWWNAAVSKINSAPGIVESKEFHVTCKDRSVRDVQISAAILEDTLLVSFVDLTERKQLEIKLGISEERHRILAENARDVIWTMELDGRISYVSPSVEKLRGITPDEAMRQPLNEILTPASQEIVLKYFSQLQGKVQAGLPPETFRGELEYWCKNGSTIWTDVLVFPRHRPNGSLELLGVTRDITERKNAEARNRQQEKIESLSCMAGAIAHNFNNLLQGVLGNLELALYDLPTGSKATADINESMRTARKAADLSSQMLTYLGQIYTTKKPIDLSAICRQALPMIRDCLPQNMDLKAELPASGPYINASTDEIQRIIGNLVNNARESIQGRSGLIKISVTKALPKEIPKSQRFPPDWQPQNHSYACMQVVDNGSGMTESCLGKIFDPFFSTKFTGRGLGLPVVSGIVKAHGGGVTVESKANEGSTFRIFIPLASEDLTP